MARKRGTGGGGQGAARDLQNLLQRRMEDCPTAEALNDRVILPFVQALEAVCGARGYVLNIYGEQSNLVFTGDPDAAADIYALVDSYLDAQAESPDDT